MSSGYGVNEVLALIQLSWNAVESATTASSKHDDLTREVSTVHDILAHVYTELSVPDASISRARSNSKAELQRYLAGCGTQLGIIHTVLVKFNALDADQKSGKQLWSKIRFANGKYQDLTEIRSRMATYSTAITMILRLISLGSRGKIERELSHQKGSLKGIRESVNLALAHINSTTRQKSLLIAYSNDSKAFWSRLRRELTNQGFSRFALNKKKDLILSYMKELDSRGVLGYSTSFGRAFQARNETNRQSHTPESFQSSSISAHCRNSNSSFQSIRYGKDSGYDSSTYDEPTCIISDPCNLPWTYSRPVNAVEHEQNTNFVLKDIKGGCKHRYNKSPSPSIPFRIRAEPDFTFPLETTNGLVDMPTQPCSMHSPFHESPRMRRRRSAKEIEQYIRFEDPYGREFSFPLSEAKSWEVGS